MNLDDYESLTSTSLSRPPAVSQRQGLPKIWLAPVRKIQREVSSKRPLDMKDVPFFVCYISDNVYFDVDACLVRLLHLPWLWGWPMERHKPIRAPVAHFGGRLGLRPIIGKASRTSEVYGSASHTYLNVVKRALLSPI